MNQAVAIAFEKSFLSASLEQQIRGCDSYELAPLFLELFSKSQPVLEAGCGSGRWCGWLYGQGIAADGVDWSQALCDRAAAEMPGCRFYARDMADSGLPDGSYGGLMALGSIEHSLDGPGRALAEFYRLLRPSGVAVITVPYGGRLRRGCRALSQPLELAKGSRLLRRLTGKAPLAPQASTMGNARQGTNAAWHPQFALSLEGWSFYEYAFNRQQMDGFLAAAGFRIVRRFAAFTDEGLYHTFGRLAGRWNDAAARVDLTPAGRLLRKVLPTSLIGHMLCYVVKKPATR
ncbi:MAG: class I SAM-dependent methyltransferase [Bryobacterales bacterium]|nr:class I SAM-dependent methyltransferase [Bryobacterales bacterium]